MVALLRVLLMIATLVCLSLTLSINVISAQGDDQGLVPPIVTTDEACRLPCWEQIYPGRTSASDAIAILSGRPWANAVRRVNGGILVEWREGAPDWLDPGFAGTVRVRGDTIGPILLKSRLKVGDFYFSYGMPDLVDTSVTGGLAQILLYYTEEKMGLGLSLRCPVTLLDLWTAQPVVRLDSRQLYPGGPFGRDWVSKLPVC